MKGRLDDGINLFWKTLCGYMFSYIHSNICLEGAFAIFFFLRERGRDLLNVKIVAADLILLVQILFFSFSQISTFLCLLDKNQEAMPRSLIHLT